MDKPAPPHKDADLLVGPQADPYSEYYDIDMMEGRAGPRDPRPSRFVTDHEPPPDLTVKVVIGPLDGSTQAQEVWVRDRPNDKVAFLKAEARDYAVVIALGHAAKLIARGEHRVGEPPSFRVKVDIEEEQ